METYGIGDTTTHADSERRIPEYGIRLLFQIRNMDEYKCMCQFAEEYHYAPPKLTYREKQGELKAETAEEWKQATQRNDAKHAHVTELLRQLEDATDFCFDANEEEVPKSKNLEDLRRFYHWTQEPVFPIMWYEIVEADKKRTKEIWMDSGLLQYCKPYA